MKKILIVISSVLFFYAFDVCLLKKDNFWYNYKGPFCYKKMNQNEQIIIDSLNKRGYDSTEIYKPIIGLHGPLGSNIYNVFLKQKRVLFEKPDKQEEFKKLAITLYKNVISNAFIEDMEYISIQYNYCFIKKNKKLCDEKYYTFLKDSLEFWCGFKVLKVGKEHKRFYLPQ